MCVRSRFLLRSSVDSEWKTLRNRVFFPPSFPRMARRASQWEQCGVGNAMTLCKDDHWMPGLISMSRACQTLLCCFQLPSKHSSETHARVTLHKQGRQVSYGAPFPAREETCLVASTMIVTCETVVDECRPPLLMPTIGLFGRLSAVSRFESTTQAPSNAVHNYCKTPEVS